MALNQAWLRAKIAAYSDAWFETFAARPSKQNVALAVSVAIHETRAGDAWPGPDGIVGTSDDENNWGATTLRPLNATEQWILATAALELLIKAGFRPRGTYLKFDNFRYTWRGLDEGVDVQAMQKALGVAVDGKLGPKTTAAFEVWTEGNPIEPEDVWPKLGAPVGLTSPEAKALESMMPSVAPGHAARASEAMATLRRGLLHTGYELPAGVIHCDSTPERGAYFVWFATFTSPKAGAAYFIRLLNRWGKAVLERGGTPYELAAAMYADPPRRSGYYTGFYKDTVTYEDGLTGREKNIAAYASRIAASYASVLAAA